MALQTAVVIFDAASRKHVPLLAADKIDRQVIDLAATSMAFNASTGVLTVTFADGSTRTATLNTLAADQFLQGAAYNSATATLVLTMSNGTVFNVPLGDLVAITSANTGNVKFAGTGTSALPLTAEVDLATTAAPTAEVDDGTTPTIFIGGNGKALGEPVGWIQVKVAGVVRKVPFYA